MMRRMMPKMGRALLVPGLLIAGGAAVAAPPPPVTMTTQVTAPAHVKRGAPAALSVAVADKTIVTPSAVVDLEVYDAKGKRVAQNIWQGQKLVKGKSSVYHWAWKPAAAGAYTVKLGVFGAGWKPLYHWDDKAVALTVS